MSKMEKKGNASNALCKQKEHVLRKVYRSWKGQPLDDDDDGDEHVVTKAKDLVNCQQEQTAPKCILKKMFVPKKGAVACKSSKPPVPAKTNEEATPRNDDVGGESSKEINNNSIELPTAVVEELNSEGQPKSLDLSMKRHPTCSGVLNEEATQSERPNPIPLLVSNKEAVNQRTTLENNNQWQWQNAQVGGSLQNVANNNRGAHIPMGLQQMISRQQMPQYYGKPTIINSSVNQNHTKKHPAPPGGADLAGKRAKFFESQPAPLGYPSNNNMGEAQNLSITSLRTGIPPIQNGMPSIAGHVNVVNNRQNAMPLHPRCLLRQAHNNLGSNNNGNCGFNYQNLDCLAGYQRQRQLQQQYLGGRTNLGLQNNPQAGQPRAGVQSERVVDGILNPNPNNPPPMMLPAAQSYAQSGCPNAQRHSAPASVPSTSENCMDVRLTDSGEILCRIPKDTNQTNKTACESNVPIKFTYVPKPNQVVILEKKVLANESVSANEVTITTVNCNGDARFSQIFAANQRNSVAANGPRTDFKNLPRSLEGSTVEGGRDVATATAAAAPLGQNLSNSSDAPRDQQNLVDKPPEPKNPITLREVPNNPPETAANDHSQGNGREHSTDAPSITDSNDVNGANETPGGSYFDVRIPAPRADRAPLIVNLRKSELRKTTHNPYKYLRQERYYNNLLKSAQEKEARKAALLGMKEYPLDLACRKQYQKLLKKREMLQRQVDEIKVIDNYVKAEEAKLKNDSKEQMYSRVRDFITANFQGENLQMYFNEVEKARQRAAECKPVSESLIKPECNAGPVTIDLTGDSESKREPAAGSALTAQTRSQTSKAATPADPYASLIPFEQGGAITAEQYVRELTELEAHPSIPEDFKEFYKFVTKVQIMMRQRPVSFVVFLNLHNNNCLARYHQQFIKYMDKKKSEPVFSGT